MVSGEDGLDQKRFIDPSLMDYIIQIAAWTFLPRIGAGILHSIVYKAGLKSRQQEGSPSWNADRRWCHIVVVVGYLMYLMISIELKLTNNFYHVIGTFPLADEKDIRSAYRKSSLLYHPDKIMDATDQAANRIVAINNAYEVLKDPVRKNVYDHLGVSSLISCKNCLTYKEYLTASLGETMTFYLGTVIGTTSITMIGGRMYAPYWRFVLFLILVSLDILWTTNIKDPLSWFISWRTPAEKIILAKELFIVLSIALNQIGPIFFPIDSRTLKDLVLELEGLTHKEFEGSISRMMRIYGPFSKKGSDTLKAKLEKHYVEKILEADPEFDQTVKSFLADRNKYL